MNYCIFRSAKLKTHQDVVNVLKEQQRAADYDSKRADKSRSDQNSYSSDYEKALKKYDSLLPKNVRKNAVVGLNFVVSTSQEFQKKADEKEFYAKAREFIGENFGEVVAWAIHRDETSTHMQVVTIPLVKGKLNARALIGGSKNRMNEIQTEFFNKVGKEFGLERGKENSTARHQTVEQYHRQQQKKLDEKFEDEKKAEQRAENFVREKQDGLEILTLGNFEDSDIGTPEKLERVEKLKKNETAYQFACRVAKKIWTFAQDKVIAPMQNTIKQLKTANTALLKQNKRLSEEFDKVVDQRVESRSTALLEPLRAENKALKAMLFEKYEFKTDSGIKCNAKSGLLDFAKKAAEENLNFRKMSPEEFKKNYEQKKAEQREKNQSWESWDR